MVSLIRLDKGTLEIQVLLLAVDIIWNIMFIRKKSIPTHSDPKQMNIPISISLKVSEENINYSSSFIKVANCFTYLTPVQED